MRTVRELLDRIRWDSAYGAAEFELGYWDRRAKDIVRTPLASVVLEPGAAFLRIAAPDGVSRRVPLHRVRRVWRDGELVWMRDPERRRGRAGA